MRAARIIKLISLMILLFIINSCGNQTLECEDLLKRYAEEISKIEFLECKKRNGQTILQATYKVLGKNAEEVEALLIKKYGIGELKFTCCGWESTNGKNGFIENEELKKINPNYILEISMSGSAEMKNDSDEFYLELEKNKIDFYVIVKLLNV